MSKLLALLSWKVWVGVGLVLALAYSHFEAYSAGGASVKAEWVKETNKASADALVLSEANRTKEKALADSVQTVKVNYEKKLQATAARAVSLADSLRSLQATIDSGSGAIAQGSCGVDGFREIEGELLGSCAKRLVGLATEAERLTDKVTGLQDFVKSVDLAP